MGWTATERYSLAFAPGGLGFVQDLLNTAAAGRPPGPDLLADLASAQRWLGDALATYAPFAGHEARAPTLTRSDLAQLRTLRAEMRSSVAGHGQPGGLPLVIVRSAHVAVRLDSSGDVKVEPEGPRIRRIAAMLLIEMYRAQLTGDWLRLKMCRNPRCAMSFFDRSRNQSGVWHDARVCGNAANLRASRERRKHHESAT